LSFASPLLLLSLLAIPALAAIYMWSRRRPGRYAVRFPGTPVLAGMVAAVPRWRRHVPAAVAALALTVLVLALARPHATVAVPVERASVVLVTDVSRSMRATDVEPTRLDAARGAAEAFLDSVPDELRVGAVAFSSTPHSAVAPTHDHEQIRLHLESLDADGSTATGDGLAEALALLRSDEGGRDAGGGTGGERRRPPAAIVMLSDGKKTTGRDPLPVARQARREGVPIHTVSLGTPGATIRGGTGVLLPVPPDPETMARIAELSGGKSFDVSESGELGSIYEGLGSQLATRPEKREITAGFAAGGLVLLLTAAGLSLRSAGRLP
jgi:Ca-activated chloride channel family protein